MDTKEAVTALADLHERTSGLPVDLRLAVRIHELAKLQQRRIPNLAGISLEDAHNLAHASLPDCALVQRFTYADITLMWAHAYAVVYGEAASTWLHEIGDLFEWARAPAEEAGELMEVTPAMPGFMFTLGKWVAGVRF